MSSLALRGVVKHFRGAELIRAVDDVSLEVGQGQLVAIYGPSGSGKTTLLQLAASLMHPDAGVISFGGRDISQLTSIERSLYRRRDVGLILQSFHLIPGATALDNASVKLLADGYSLREAKLRAGPWLDRVGLGARMEHAAARLSSGERQRVAIARALANEPGLLLADEPTSSLDSVRSREILALMRDICAERDIPGLLVTHDPWAAPYASGVHTLRDGRLTEGLSAELMPPPA